MKISRLRLLGFKSFVEPTELVIEPGLTGVVGPNGCGKSNLLEALRWVMGETSHKSMRAAAMDDVIFSGTNHRPARHFAEVTLFLDNSARQAPAEFNDRDQIEITRRIEREAGSSYRINAREARARDIKLLFEDAATGARSPALVRQGQIAEIVNAKPEQRRRILEDAAGVAGLHSRRHEAELRLKAAEANLARVADVLGQVTSQMESLKRQARQARRYKELSDEIRRAEALALHLAWTDAHNAVTAEEKAHEAALGTLAELTSREAAAMVAEQRSAEALPGLREAEAKKAAALARLKHEAENFEREVTRAIERQKDLQSRAVQLAADLAREEAQVLEAAEFVSRLEAEAAELSETDAIAGDGDIEAHEKHAEARQALAEADARLASATARAAETRAALRSLETGLTERRENRERLQRQLSALETQTREVAARAPDVRQLTDVQSLGQQLAAELLDIEAATLTAEALVQRLAEDVRVKRREAETARLNARSLTTERETLARLLIAPQTAGLPGIVDQLRVSAGYETALGAALGDDLEAPRLADDTSDAETDAAPPPLHWRLIETAPSDPALPAEAEPLAKHVKGPPELKRRLKQTGVVLRELGARLQAHLKPGQRLVSREGDLWRWDGFVAAAEGATAAAQRLAQRNRLTAIEYDEAQAVEAAELIAEAEALAVEALAEAETEERQLRQSWRATQVRLAEARERLTRIEQSARETEGRLAAVNEARERAEDDLQTALTREAELSEALALADPADVSDADLATARAECDRWRAAVSSAAALLAEQQRARRARSERLAAIAAEHKRWSDRRDAAQSHVDALRGRAETAAAELDALAELPSNLGERRDALFSAIATADAERRQAGDELATAETALKDSQQALRAVQANVSNEREARARIEARLEAARTRRQDEARRIREALGVVPEGCLPLAGLAVGDPLPPLADVDRQVTRLKADRERLGGVNLQADDELEAMSTQFSTLDAERADVEQAVAKLRGAIGQINREARKRLAEAFTTVDGHFRRLFATLFGGGEARLEMIEGDDPLESGLEIVAKPPGKKPATLSLLSGGEQTLTALSLIFAVFLTNPSPICVLDEVDAPLDDANVDRFCTLMEKMAEETATRFLVITHHPMTMARMNRLFGVTMAERGVSQLVSVDLETAAQFLEAV